MHYNTQQHIAAHCNILKHTAKRFSRMQLIATHCNILQHTATNYDTLWHTTHTAEYCNTLQYAAPHCSTLQHIAPHCNTLQHIATYCNILQHTATYCKILQHTATHCKTLQKTTALQHSATYVLAHRQQDRALFGARCVADQHIEIDVSCQSHCLRLLQYIVVCCSVMQCMSEIQEFSLS